MTLIRFSNFLWFSLINVCYSVLLSAFVFVQKLGSLPCGYELCVSLMIFNFGSMFNVPCHLVTVFAMHSETTHFSRKSSEKQILAARACMCHSPFIHKIHSLITCAVADSSCPLVAAHKTWRTHLTGLKGKKKEKKTFQQFVTANIWLHNLIGCQVAKP